MSSGCEKRRALHPEELGRRPTLSTVVLSPGDSLQLRVQGHECQLGFEFCLAELLPKEPQIGKRGLEGHQKIHERR